MVAVAERTARPVNRAVDPAVSVCVEASAGTGKTKVLVDRVLNLLLAGAAPSAISTRISPRAIGPPRWNRLVVTPCCTPEPWSEVAQPASEAATSSAPQHDREILISTPPRRMRLYGTCNEFSAIKLHRTEGASRRSDRNIGTAALLDRRPHGRFVREHGSHGTVARKRLHETRAFDDQPERLLQRVHTRATCGR